MSQLFQRLSDAIVSHLQPQRRADLPELCNIIELPHAPNNLDLTKRKYLLSRVEQLQDNPNLTLRVAVNFVERYSVVEQPDESVFAIEELLWNNSDYPSISKKIRREIAKGLEEEDLWVDTDGFLNALSRLWVLESSTDKSLRELGFGHGSNSLRRQIQQHLIKNSDWSPNDFFTKLGAFDCSNKRFCKLIEALVGPEVRPDETRQRSFAEAANSVLFPNGLELAETGNADGYPIYTLQATGTGAAGQPKNLIFASSVKPDLRFRDALTNDIEIVTNADKVLVYDRPIPDTGLRWRDLQDWWKERNECRDDEAKKALYYHLISSLPEKSPPQKLLFTTFYKHFQKDIPSLPALLPEVWLHYDPKTITQRGRDALLRQRMDFLLLISPNTRVVIEVDGRHHYSDETDRADPIAYAKMVAADRDLRLCGYDVYRFGGSDLQEQRGATQLVEKFFEDLFRKHNVLP